MMLLRSLQPILQALLLTCMLAVPTLAYSLEDPAIARYRTQVAELMEAYVSIYGFSGTIKVVKAGQPISTQSYGLANRSFQIPMAPDHRISINSISKTFTATAVMMLVEAGKIDLQRPIAAYLPELTAPWKEQVTVHHLLTHSSGLPRESGIQWFDQLTLQQQVVQLINAQDLAFAPGSRYDYSNTGITLLGRIIETTSGQSYADYLQEHIIQPLGLQNTGVYQGSRVVERQAVPYKVSSNGVAETQRSKHLGENAGGGMYATVDDLYRFVLALEQHELLSPATTALMFNGHLAIDDGDQAAYGWTLKAFGAQQLRFASGSGYGSKSVVIRAPASDDFIAITSNWGNTPILQMMAGLFFIINDLDYQLPSQQNLPRAEDYRSALGRYRFAGDTLQTQLMYDGDTMVLQLVDGRLFLNEDLLVSKAEQRLGFAYTDELLIEFKPEQMIITINGHRLVGQRIGSKTLSEGLDDE